MRRKLNLKDHKDETCRKGEICDNLGIYETVQAYGLPIKKINSDYLNKWKPSHLATETRGRIMIGPMRIMQFRVREKPCKRYGKNKRY